jgi:oligopeptidase B
MSLPTREYGYIYFHKYEKERPYPIHYRRKVGENTDEILLDINEMAKGYKHYKVSGITISPDNCKMSFAVDTLGDKRCTIYFKNLVNGNLYNDYLPNARGTKVVWANDSRTVFYVLLDSTFRPYKIKKHILGKSWIEDVIVYHEKDRAFNTGVFGTKLRTHIKIFSGSDKTSEIRLIDADYPNSTFQLMNPREKNLKYLTYHVEDKIFIQTNWNAPNGKIMYTHVTKLPKKFWNEFIPHRKNVQIERIEYFKDYLVIIDRHEGLIKFRILNLRDNSDYYLNINQKNYLAFPLANPGYYADTLRIGIITPVHPPSYYAYHMGNKTRKLLKRQELKGDYNPKDYVSNRLYAKAKDGTSIPISILHSKNLVLNGQNPLLLSGYGAYGFIQDAFFRPELLSLLERGFVYAIAHVRGGGELGKSWHEEGRLLKKINTFTDFIACAEYLIDRGYTNLNKLFAVGGSAGGLLMGAVVNMRPDFLKGIILGVPFLDVISSLLDESEPGTTEEYSEWGNPNEKQYYDYMLKYSPYDNVRRKEYPTMLVTAGLYDSSVPYWQPAKWVAKLREFKTDNNMLLLYTNMQAGHKGSTGRFQGFKNTAMEYAFILNQLGITE